MWLGDSNYALAGSIKTLIKQLQQAYPSTEWQTNGGTGTLGDAVHRAEGSASDHNPWLNNTVRALDVAANIPGCPDGEALFAMVNRMYAAHDPRVFPYGYAIYKGRITDWDNPGGFHAQQGDPHDTHVHLSVGQTGYNATNPWPLGATTEDSMSAAEVAEIKSYIDSWGKQLLAGSDPQHMNNLTNIRNHLLGLETALGNANVRMALLGNAVDASTKDLKAALTAVHVATTGGQPVDLAPVLAALNALPAKTAAEISTRLGA
ncbi:MAG: hypothetical protein QOH56_2791 [Pseudonocardiales bacterium]|jgi:hypothetical protein|nr:hypothetical protein [Pseudonocardiales bacterium]